MSMIRCHTTLLANRMFYTTKLPNCEFYGVSYAHNLSQLPALSPSSLLTPEVFSGWLEICRLPDPVLSGL